MIGSPHEFSLADAPWGGASFLGTNPLPSPFRGTEKLSSWTWRPVSWRGRIILAAKKGETIRIPGPQ